MPYQRNPLNLSTMNTEYTPRERKAIAEALKQLNAFQSGFPEDALVPARFAGLECSKVKGWSTSHVLVRLEPLCAWVATVHGETALELVNSELLMGWFEGDGEDPSTEDADGDFMSTPSVTEDEDHPAEDIQDALRHCARDGFIAIG